MNVAIGSTTNWGTQTTQASCSNEPGTTSTDWCVNGFAKNVIFVASRWVPRRFWVAQVPNSATGTRTSVANTTVLPSYVRADAMLEYDRGTWAVRLNVQNLFDEKYYEGLYTAHAVPGTARVAQLTGIYRF